MKLRALIFMGLASYAATAWASGTEGHGGQTVDLNGKPALRDLVDKTVCDWVPGAKFADGIQHFPAVTSSIEQSHWRTAQELKLEVQSLNICKTEGPLVFIPDGQSVGVTIYLEGLKQVAVRMGDDVYLDTTIYDQMTARDQAYLLLHEALHGFMANGASNRMIKLRTFVKFVSDHETNPASLQEFVYQADRNSIVIPLLDDSIQKLKSYFYTVLDAPTPTKQSALALSYLYSSNKVQWDAVNESLTYRNKKLVYDTDNLLLSFLNPILENNDDVALAALIKEGFNPNFLSNPLTSFSISTVAGYSLTELVISNCNTKIAETLLNQPSVSLDTSDEVRPENLLKLAIDSNCTDIVQYLESRNDLKTGDYDTANFLFTHAFQTSDVKLLNFLAAQNQTFVFSQQYIASALIAPGKSPEFIEAVVNLKDQSGKYRIPMTNDFISGLILQGHAETFKAILERSDVDPNGTTSNFDVEVAKGDTFLMQAAEWSNVEVQQVLLNDPRVNVNISNPNANPNNGSATTALEILIKNAYGMQNHDDVISLVKSYVTRPGTDLKHPDALAYTKSIKSIYINDDYRELYNDIIKVLKAAGA